eukprot:g22455.t1
MGSCRLLEAWDTAKTDALKEARPGKSKRGSSVRLQLAQERAAAQDVEDENNVRNEEERLQLARQKITAKLCELTEKGEKTSLQTELMDLDRKEETRRHEIVSMLLEEFGFAVNPRDSKGWTPISIAAFHGHKKVCQVLMAKKADPSIENAYRKDAFTVAKDDEIREVLKGMNLSEVHEPILPEAPTQASMLLLRLQWPHHRVKSC